MEPPVNAPLLVITDRDDPVLGLVREIDFSGNGANSLSPKKLEAISKALKEARDRTIIFKATPQTTPKNEKIFSGGFDLKVLAEMAENKVLRNEGKGVSNSIYDLWGSYRRILRHPKPTIVFVNPGSHVYGGANGFVFACDYVIAGAKAEFKCPVKEDLQFFSIFAVPVLAEKLKAKGKDISVLGLGENRFDKAFSSEQAYELGLVDLLCGDLNEGLYVLGQQIKGTPTRTSRKMGIFPSKARRMARKIHAAAVEARLTQEAEERRQDKARKQLEMGQK